MNKQKFQIDEQLFTPSSKDFKNYSQDAFLDSYRDWVINHDMLRKEALQNDLTEVFIQGLIQRIGIERKNITISIFGKARTGKSGFAQGIYHIIKQIQNGQESIDDIVFTQEELKENKNKFTTGSTICVDEDFRFNTGLGINSVNEFIDFTNQTIGIEQINLLYVGVESQQPKVYARFEVIDYNRKIRHTRAFCIDENGQPFGHIRIPAYFIKGYEKKKLEFTAKVKNNQVRRNNEYVKEIAYKIVEKLGTDLIEYSYDALKGYIRDEYASAGLSESQLYAIFDICLSHKKRMELKAGIRKKLKRVENND